MPTASERIRALREAAETPGREAVMATETTYNGWTNYPTWAVNLWLSNDEPLYREALERTSNAVAGSFSDSVFTAQEAARFAVAEMMKEWVTDELAPDLGASFAADLLGYALGEVDWEEIAGAWIESALEAV